MFSDVGLEIRKTTMLLVWLQTTPHLLLGIILCLLMVDSIGVVFSVLLAVSITVGGYGLTYFCATKIRRLGEMKGRSELADFIFEKTNIGEKLGNLN